VLCVRALCALCVCVCFVCVLCVCALCVCFVCVCVCVRVRVCVVLIAYLRDSVFVHARGSRVIVVCASCSRSPALPNCPPRIRTATRQITHQMKDKGEKFRVVSSGREGNIIIETRAEGEKSSHLYLLVRKEGK
jgi:hypothetical protein